MYKTIAYFCLVGSPVFLIAEVVPNSCPASEQVFSGGALSVLCWALWYLLARSQPKLQTAILDAHKAHITAQEKARSDFKESLHELTESIDKMAEAIRNIRRQPQQETDNDTPAG